MMNMHGLLSAGLNEKYKREFDIFTELEAERKALRAVGKRDGLVQFYQSFTSKVPGTLIAMVAAKFGEEFAGLNFPPAAGKFVFGGSSVPVFREHLSGYPFLLCTLLSSSTNAVLFIACMNGVCTVPQAAVASLHAKFRAVIMAFACIVVSTSVYMKVG